MIDMSENKRVSDLYMSLGLIIKVTSPTYVLNISDGFNVDKITAEKIPALINALKMDKIIDLSSFIIL